MKYTIKKAYAYDLKGKERVIWYVMDGEHIVDAFVLKRTAQFYCDLWNKENGQ